MINEIWKDIDGFEGLYQVSNLGRVKSLGNDKSRREKILKLGNCHGYLQVNLCKNGKRKKLCVHRLVAQTFLQNPQNLPEVNHKDEDKTNNSVENLEWVSSKENVNFGTRNLRVAEKLSKKVFQYSKNGDFIREWASTHEVQRQLGFAASNISKCCLGNLKSAYGFIWKYK